jgi:hypothetical protein
MLDLEFQKANELCSRSFGCLFMFTLLIHNSMISKMVTFHARSMLILPYHSYVYLYPRIFPFTTQRVEHIVPHCLKFRFIIACCIKIAQEQMHFSPVNKTATLFCPFICQNQVTGQHPAEETAIHIMCPNFEKLLDLVHTLQKSAV